MLSLVLHADDLGADWTTAPDGWNSGRSFIRPYAHPALQAAMFVAPRRIAVIVRERIRGRPATSSTPVVASCSDDELDSLLAKSRAWPLEFVELLIDRASSGRQVQLRCGHWGTAPVYLLAGDGVLRADWQVARLYPHLPSDRLDPASVAECIMNFDVPYSRRTIFPDLLRLTERSTATWKPPQRSVVVDYPSAAPRARASLLADDAPVERTFRQILTSSLARWIGDAGDTIAVQLSGGLDSSLVAAAAAEAAPGRVRSFGLIMPGKPGLHQRARRRAVVRRCGLVDRPIRALDHPPFSPRSRRTREGKVGPWDEFYAEAMGAVLRAASAAGASLILTGIGGDELATLQANEATSSVAVPATGAESIFPPFATATMRDAHLASPGFDPAPRPVLHTSALEAAYAGTTLYLEAGLWPVNPLCTPELVEFCRRLPHAWRQRRTIHRRVLTSFGLPPLVTEPAPGTLEDFGDVMDFSLQHGSAAAIADLFRESRLAAQGLVDPSRLAATYEQVRLGDRRLAGFVMNAVMLELTLRSMERQRRAASPL